MDTDETKLSVVRIGAKKFRVIISIKKSQWLWTNDVFRKLGHKITVELQEQGFSVEQVIECE